MRVAPFVLGLLLMSCASDPSEACVVNRDCSENESCVNGLCQGNVDGGFDVPAPPLDVTAPDSGLCGTRCDTGMPCEVGAYDCSSGTPICAPSRLADAGFVCRESLGDCDLEEVCDGVAPTCPSDVLRAPAQVCRESTGECDVAESCTGASPLCPLDLPEAAGTECDAGFCDGAGMCVSTCTPGGTCSTGNPCEEGVITCAGGTPGCEASLVLADGQSCGRNSVGPWSDCGGFADSCDENGFEMRSESIPTCMAGRCVDLGRSNRRDCVRATEGLACDGGNTAQCHVCNAGSCTAWISCMPPTTCCPLSNMCGCRGER